MKRLALAACAWLALPAYAARPMITDDARIVDGKACQVESWAKRNADSTEYWALPACNFTGRLELTFGGARTRDGTDAFTDNVLQAKTLLRPLEPGGWGAAFTLGTVRHPQRATANGWPGDPYFNVPLSASLAGERWIAHLNGGASYRRDGKRTVGTWGFGNELQIHPRLYFIPEVYRSEPGRPFYQLGLRYWIVKDFLQMDATYGNRFVSQDRHWISIGFRILTPPFMR